MFLEAQAEAIIDTPKILTKAIDRSQHCQRNFDLSKSIPEVDMKKMVHAVTQCPSKQNVALYEAHFVTNRDVIEEMHKTTEGFDYPDGNGGVAYQTNSQVLANLVIVFTKLPINEKLFENEEVDYSVPLGYRSNAAVEWERGEISETEYTSLLRDQEQAIGIAAGYVNLTASLLGYGTGCCACFDPNDLKKAGGFDNEPALMMGIGFKNPEKNRRVHQTDENFVFPTYKKQKIATNFIK